MTLEEVKQKIPDYVKIVEDTYVEIYTKAKFIDTVYNNEEFWKPPFNVIKFQLGCNTRHIDKVRANSLLQHDKRKKEEQKDPRYSLENLLKETEKYPSRHAFFKDNPELFFKCKRMKLLGKLFNHKDRKLYTMEELEDICRGVEHQCDLAKINPAALYRIRHLKLLKHFFPKNKVERLPDDEILERMKQYPSKTELEKSNPALSALARSRKLLYRVFETTEAARIRRKEELRQIALKYKSMKEFDEFDPGSISFIRKHNYTDELCGHMLRQNHTRGQQTTRFILDKLLGLECQYNTRKILGGLQELDLYYPSIKLAVEYQGSYYHASEENIKRDLKKSNRCKELGITLIYVYESDNPPHKLIDESVLIKQEIVKNLPTINSVANTAIQPEDVTNMQLDILAILRTMVSLDDITEAISKCEYKSDFCNNYLKLYRIVKRNNLDYLLDNLKTGRKPKKPKPVKPKRDVNNWAQYNDDQLLEYIKNNFTHYSQILYHKVYDVVLTRKLMSRIKEFLPFKRNYTQHLSNDEFISMILSKFSDYKEFKEDNLYIQSFKRKLLPKIKELMKNRSNHP